MCEGKEPVNHLRLWPLYICCIFMLFTITSMFVSNTFLASGILLQMLFLVFSNTASEELHQMPTDIQTSSLLASPNLHCHLLQCRYYSVDNPVNWANIPIRFECLPIVLLSFQHYFCVDKSQSLSYKTLKVYLAAICVMHIENGFTDLTTDESMHLVCKGICRQQSSSECGW